MENEKIVIKGTPKKNKVADILIMVGAALAIVFFFITADYIADNYDDYYLFNDDKLYVVFFWLLLGVVLLVVGIIIKFRTEKCEITVTNSRIFGKLAHGKEVNIPLNQITALNSCSFDGVSVASIGKISNFHCIANHEEVMKAISYLLTHPQSAGAAPSEWGKASAVSGSTDKAERLNRFKNLLDSGVITQEEFDAKKKEILGL